MAAPDGRHRPRAAQRLGVLVPSSNTVLEPETIKLLPADGSVTMHVSRLRVVSIDDGETSLRQFDVGKLVAAAEMLVDAQVETILWNGTAAGWLGFDWDRQIVSTIETATGVHTTTSIIAINEELKRLAAHRIGLVTPYVRSIERRIVSNYRSIGIDIVSTVRGDLTENTDYGRVSPNEIADWVRQAATEPVDAIVVLCTNLAGASISPALSRELSVPVLDSVRVAVEHSLRWLRGEPTGRTNI